MADIDNLYSDDEKIIEEITNKILQNQDLLKFIHYLDNNIDIPSQTNLTKEQRKNLINEKIFKYQKMDLTSGNTGCYLAYDLGDCSYDDYGNWIQIEVNFWILCDVSYLQTFNGVRTRAISQCLRNSFHKKTDLKNFKMAMIKRESPIGVGSYTGRLVKLVLFNSVK